VLLFSQDPNIAPVFVPRVRQVFSAMNDDAYDFNKDYAKIAGFSLRTARTSKDLKRVKKVRLPCICQS
jgi:hypothetical protein